MAAVRGKFKVQSITKFTGGGDAAQIKLAAQYSNTPEDNTYAQATPNAFIEMYVNNPAAIEALALGKDFYVDFTPVEEQPVAQQ